jgi:hypothetical protein
MYEKLALEVEVFCGTDGGDKLLGSFSISCKQIINCPTDEQGTVLVFGDLMDGMVCVGKVSLGCTVEHRVMPRTVRVGSTGEELAVSEVLAAGGSLVSTSPSSKLAFTVQESTRQPRWSEAVVVEMITCEELKSVHTLSRNSPCVKLECGESFRDETPPAPFAGKSATWGQGGKGAKGQKGKKEEIKWANQSQGVFRVKKQGSLSSLKVVVSSQSVVIGTVNIKGEDLLDAERSKKGRLVYSAEISKYNKVTGKISLFLHFLKESSELAKKTRGGEPAVVSGAAAAAAAAAAEARLRLQQQQQQQLHSIAEDQEDYSELLDPTYVGGGENPEGSQLVGVGEERSTTSRPDLQLTFPPGFEFSYSGTSLSHVDVGALSLPDPAAAVAAAAAPAQPAAASSSARPKTGRGSDGAATQRSNLSAASWPTERTDPRSHVDPYTDRSVSDGGSLFSSRYSSARSELYSSDGESSRGRGDGWESGSASGSSYYSRTDTDRSRGDSYYYDTGRSGYSSSTGRSSDYSDYSRSSRGSDYTPQSTWRSDSDSDYSYSQSQSTGRSGSTASSAYSVYSDEEDSEEEESDEDEEGGDAHEEEEVKDGERRAGKSAKSGSSGKSSKSKKSTYSLPEYSATDSDSDPDADPDRDAGSGELSLSQRQAVADMHPGRGFTPKPRTPQSAPLSQKSRPQQQWQKEWDGDEVVPPAFQLDLGRLQWWPDGSSRREQHRHVAREFVRGIVHATIACLAAEQVGEGYVPHLAPSACHRPLPSGGLGEALLDLAIITVKAAVLHAAHRVLRTSGAGGVTWAPASAPAAQPSPTPALPAQPPVAYKKRQALIFTEGFNNTTKVEWTQEEQQRNIDPDDKVFGKIRGNFTVPILKAEFQLLDLMGFDVSFLHPRVMPVRPYLTACKPFSDWGAETGPVWFGNRGLETGDMKVGYQDLSGQWGWPNVTLRLGQNLIFDWHDSGSGLIFAKLRVQYEMMEAVPVDSEEILTMYCEAEIANEYGGGITAGVLRAKVDLQCNYWQRPLKPPVYWEKHRIHHWKTYPVPTISAGQVKSKFREESRDYDKQMYVHPALFGFRIRWRCDPHKHDESKFINPIFMNFTLAKKPPTKRMEEEARRNLAMKNTPNLWHWDVTAHLRGKCPVCGDGLPGCPRCWMLPSRPNGDLLACEDFEFDPDAETRRLAKEEQTKREKAAARDWEKKNKKMLIAAGKIRDDESDDEEEDSVLRREREMADEAGMTKDEIHTKLTTFKAIRLYRTVVSEYIIIYVKGLPGSYIRKLVMEPSDTVYNLWNKFCSHADIGLNDSKMFVLPTSRGFFEMHGEQVGGDDKVLADNRGADTLRRYGISQRGSTVTVIFCPNYVATYTVLLLQSFFMRNTSLKIDGTTKTYNQTDELVPEVLHQDFIQQQLSSICEHLYDLQQREYKRSYEELGELFRVGAKADIDARIKAKKEEKRKADELKARLRRLESQLAGVEGPEREAKLRELMEREAHKKGSVSEDQLFLQREKEAASKERVARLREKQEQAKRDREVKGALLAKIGGSAAKAAVFGGTATATGAGAGEGEGEEEKKEKESKEDEDDEEEEDEEEEKEEEEESEERDSDSGSDSDSEDDSDFLYYGESDGEDEDGYSDEEEVDEDADGNQLQQQGGEGGEGGEGEEGEEKGLVLLTARSERSAASQRSKSSSRSERGGGSPARLRAAVKAGQAEAEADAKAGNNTNIAAVAGAGAEGEREGERQKERKRKRERGRERDRQSR